MILPCVVRWCIFQCLNWGHLFLFLASSVKKVWRLLKTLKVFKSLLKFFLYSCLHKSKKHESWEFLLLVSWFHWFDHQPYCPSPPFFFFFDPPKIASYLSGFLHSIIFEYILFFRLQHFAKTSLESQISLHPFKIFNQRLKYLKFIDPVFVSAQY